MFTVLPITRRLAGSFLVVACAWSGALAQQPAARLAPTPVVSDPQQLYYPSPALIKARAEQAARQPHRSKSAPTSAGRADNTGNLVANGDFEIQYSNTSPSGPLNIATPIPSTADELPNWFTPNYTSPDYFASNATNPDASPNNTLRGPYPPITVNGTNPVNNDGAVGIVYSTFLGTSPNWYPEYVAQQLATPLEAVPYYAEFWALPADSFNRVTSLGLYVANNANRTTTFTGTQTNYSNPPVRLASSGREITSGAIANRTQWTRVSGVITANAGDNFVCIGYNNPDVTQLDVNSPGRIAACYYYIDDVLLTRIPTAGPSLTLCRATADPVLLGTGGGSAPGLSYAWTSSTTGATVLSRSQRYQASVGYFPVIYTLTVTLPNGSTHITSTTLTPQGYGTAVSGTVNNVDHYGEAVCTYSNLAVTASNIPGSTNDLTWVVDGLSVGEYTGFLDLGTSVQITPTRPHLYGPADSRSFNLILYQGTCPIAAYGFTVVNTFDGIVYCGYEPRGTAAPQLELAMYPNPASESVQFTVSAGLTKETPTTVRIYNRFGKLVKTEQLTGKGTISTAGLPEGVYHVRAEAAGRTLQKQLSIER
jgi:Secretion system C-terminal sorting domain